MSQRRRVESLECRSLFAATLSVTVEFGIPDPVGSFHPSSKLAGATVWIDSDGDRKHDKAEPTAVTNAQGVVRFSGLADGNYTLGIEPMPAPHYTLKSFLGVNFSSSERDGSWGVGSDPKINATTGKVYFDGDRDGQPYSADYDKPLAGRTVYIDANNNYKFDADEPHFLTNSGGFYELRGYDDSAVGKPVRLVVGSGDQVTDFNPDLRAFAPTDSTGQADFGVYFKTANSTFGFRVWSSSGDPVRGARVFVDYNRNGKRDVHEPLAETSKKGIAKLDVFPGKYQVVLMAPEGFTAGRKRYELSVKELMVTNVKMRVAPNRHLNIAFFEDKNANGRRDRGESLKASNIPLVLQSLSYAKWRQDFGFVSAPPQAADGLTKFDSLPPGAIDIDYYVVDRSEPWLSQERHFRLPTAWSDGDQIDLPALSHLT